MKKIVLYLALLTLCSGVFAQSSESLEELRLFTGSTVLKAEQEARKLATDSVVISTILYNSSETPLGLLLSDLLVAKITNNSNLNFLGNTSYSYEEERPIILEGVIHQLDDVLYMQLKIIDSQNRTPLAIIEKTMDYTPLSSLLVDPYYDDYYYDTPVVTDDPYMEPNNSAYNSVEYTLGESLELALTRNDSDWFHFTLDEDLFTDDAVMVEIYTTGDIDTYMEVYGPDDPELYYGEVDDYYDSNAGMVITVDEPGTYWVSVYGYSEDISGYYYLESAVDSVEFADEYEPDNTKETAVALDWDNEQSHAFAMGDVVDMFVFTLDRSKEVTVYTESDLDTYMDLYDEYGNYIASDDDGGKDSNARIEVDLGRGTYYLEVRPYDEVGDGEYRIIADQE